MKRELARGTVKLAWTLPRTERKKLRQKWRGFVLPRTKIETFFVVDQVHSFSPQRRFCVQLLIPLIRTNNAFNILVKIIEQFSRLLNTIKMKSTLQNNAFHPLRQLKTLLTRSQYTDDAKLSELAATLFHSCHVIKNWVPSHVKLADVGREMWSKDNLLAFRK